MGLHVIIDGYNLIHALGLLPGFGADDLASAREDLCGLLASYKKIKAHKITIVFDAQHAPEYEARRDRIKGISVRYSPHGRLADSVIKNMAKKERERAIIVTSDRDVANAALASGAAAISCREFESRIMEVLYSGAETADSGGSSQRRTNTKKKGPGRREKKQKRKTRQKAKKL